MKSFNAARSEIPLDRLQRRNKTSITSLSGVQLRQITTCWKDNLMHLAMNRSLVHVLHWMKGNSTRTEAVATDEEGDDDVKG